MHTNSNGNHPAQPPTPSPAPGSEPPRERFAFRLYVAGGRASSLRSIARLKEICEEHLAGRYDLEVIDIYQQPELAVAENIVAAPTLVKKLPLPVQRLIGDLSDTDKVLLSLAIGSKPDAGDEA
ncbi:circadian clock KaiB family protein [Methylomagnum sp.]